MKTRYGFVSNSSSSSFVVIHAADKTLFADGNTEMECCGQLSINIDDMIAALVKAKSEGATLVYVDHGGGYDG